MPKYILSLALAAFAVQAVAREMGLPVPQPPVSPLWL